jgi:CBS domain containing-hemolysin-like protein
MAPVSLLLVASVSLGLAFLFSLYEYALSHYSLARIVASAKGEEAERIRAALDEEELTLVGAKILRGLTQTIGIVGFGLGLSEIRPEQLIAVLSATAATGCFLLFNVALPYVWGTRFADRIVLRGLIPFQRLTAPVRPLARLFLGLAAKLGRQEARTDKEAEITDDILSAVEEGEREGVLHDSVRRMITGIMDLREVTAGQIMTPRTEMVAVPVETPLLEALRTAVERGLSRMPVYRNSLDEVVGVLYMKDALPYLVEKAEPPALASIVRRAFLIPESKNLRELLHEMKSRQTHLAVVLDEYGGTAGLVTIEDILEEIVGEIADEHERAEPQEMVRIHDNAATVDGRTPIERLNQAMDLRVPESEEYETVGGLLFSRLGRVPEAGETVEMENVRFTVLDADARRINRVKVTVQRGG